MRVANVSRTSRTAVLRSPDLRSTSVIIFSTISFYLRTLHFTLVLAMSALSQHVRLFVLCVSLLSLCRVYLISVYGFLFALLLTLAPGLHSAPNVAKVVREKSTRILKSHGRSKRLPFTQTNYTRRNSLV